MDNGNPDPICSILWQLSSFLYRYPGSVASRYLNMPSEIMESFLVILFLVEVWKTDSFWICMVTKTAEVYLICLAHRFI